MNPASFYGKKIVCVRALPAESEDSELKSKTEDEHQSASTAVQNRGHESNSDSDSGSVNELFVRHLEGKAASKKITWKSAQPEKVKSPDITFSGAQYEPEEVKLPIEYFHDVFDKELLRKVVDESNVYSVQSNPNKPLDLVEAELEQFIGILFTSSVVKMPRARLYWSADMRYDKIASVMTLQRFESIKRFLHCNDIPLVQPAAQTSCINYALL